MTIAQRTSEVMDKGFREALVDQLRYCQTPDEILSFESRFNAKKNSEPLHLIICDFLRNRTISRPVAAKWLEVLIDDKEQKTLLSASSNQKDVKELKKNKTDISILVAEKLAKKAQDKKITKIFFDRGIYKYHGRVKIFAETLRKNGMEF